MSKMPDLHKLANAPGYGVAAHALKEKGFWKDGEGEYTVLVTYSVSYRQEVTVFADSEHEAQRKAKEEVELFPEDGATEGVDIYQTQVTGGPE